MTFLWPQLLILLLAVPALVLLYLWLLARRKKAALAYASLSLVKQALEGGPQWRRHVPPALMLGAVALLLLAVARPTAQVLLPSEQETIILAMDISGSMRAKDVEPNRLVAAQNAARAFVADLPPKVKIGVVAFAGTATVVQQPTHNREDVLAAIDRFQLQRGTATGSAIIVSLATLFPDAGIDVSNEIYGNARRWSQPSPFEPSAKKADEPKREFTPVAPGSYRAGAVILLTDGQRTTGPDPLKAAREAADRGVRVYTVGIGTKEGEVITFEGWAFRARLDEESMKQVAALTAAEYYYAGTAEDLKKVYQALSSKIVFEKRQQEVTALFAGLAAALMLAAAGLSFAWFNRLL